jgi:CubicO group peptidase (beta-lactamase class C family)
MRPFITLLFTAVIGLVSSASAQSVDSIVQYYQSSYEVPGVSVGIIKGGRIIYKKAVGVTSVESRQPVTTRSDFHLASVSKTFAATAIMKLAAAGKVSLDQRLITYLPSFKMKDSSYQQITLRQILTHTSGIPDVRDYDWAHPQTDDAAVIRYIQTFADQSLDFKPGTQFKYSNAAYNLLAAVIAQVTGVTFETYLQQEIFTPLQMTTTTFLKPSVMDSAALPHIADDNLQISVSKIYPYNRIHAASSTLHSNVDDMLHWAQFWTTDTNSLKTIMTTGQRPLWGVDSMCLGFFSTKIDGKKVVYHAGSDLGFRSFFAFVPADSLGVIVMANNNLVDTRAIAVNIIRGGAPDPIPVYFLLKNVILTAGIAKTKDVYFSEKNKSSSKYSFNAKDLDVLGRFLLDKKHYQEAIDVFLFNIELDPATAGWYDSAGDGYKAMGKHDLALESYQKALKIDPNRESTRNKILQLGN